MTKRNGPIYEVTFFVDQDLVTDFDVWLESQVRESLRVAVIADSRIFTVSGEENDRAGRVCQFLLESDASIDNIVDDEGARLQAEAKETFGDAISVETRALREEPVTEVLAYGSPNCLNCGTRLRGQYCGNCGQRSRSRLISLWELISDAFGDLFEIDSRLWQTLVPLVIRPGRLTHDYLQGRRARFMPPFRMYLVLSLVFFLVAFFDPREELGLLFEPESDIQTTSESAPTPVAGEPGTAGTAEERKREIYDKLSRDGIIVGNTTGNELADQRRSFSFSVDDDDNQGEDCGYDQSDVEQLPGWLGRRLTVERVQRICERAQLDNGRAFIDNLIDNIPAALIVLLPLIAFMLKVLYPLSRRYYVEHLLFFVHFHAFLFLILSLQIMFARVADLVSLPDVVKVLTLVVTSFYVPVYLFVALRKVYGQGRFVTFLKYIMLTIAYASGLIATMLGALAIAAFSL